MSLLFIVLLPMLGALLAGIAPSRERAQTIALVAAASTFGLTALSAFQLASGDAPLSALALDLGALGQAPLLVFDGLGAPWIVAMAVIALVVLAATPRTMLARANIIAKLATMAATAGVLLSRNVGLIALFWTLALVPGALLVLRARTDRSHARTYFVLALGASIPMIAAAVLLAQAGLRAGLASPLDLDALSSLSLPMDAQGLLFALLLASVMIRMGLFPFHSWLPPLAERGPVGVVGLLVGVHTGLFIVAKVLIPLLPEASAAAMPWVTGFALVGALFGAVVALAQTDLARTLGFVACSQAGMLLVGMASLEQASLQGALIQSVGSGVAFVGVLIVIRAVEARCGTRDVRQLGGLVQQAPRASAMFFVLAAATIGFPGSLGFIGEDLLVHGVLHAHPVAAVILLLSTALNGITLFRAFCRGFLGRPAARPRTAPPRQLEDLVLRERIATSALIVLLVGFGLAPSPLLDARRDHVDQMTHSTARAPEAHAERRAHPTGR